MDREVLVDQIHKLERELRKEYGTIALLLLVSPDPSLDDNDWHLVVSARGFNQMSRADGIRQVVFLLRRVLTKDVWQHIYRVSAFRTDDPVVKEMTSKYHTARSVVDLPECTIYGVDISKGMLFISRKLAA